MGLSFVHENNAAFSYQVYGLCNGLISRFLSSTCTESLALKTLVSAAD